MNAPSKPQPCAQNWLAMQPTANGRLCAQCTKEIYDFSAMSWPQIVQTQAQHGNSLCGMYSGAQLAHWGYSPPSACAQLAAATTLALTLASLPASAQQVELATAAPGASLTLSGTVTSVSAQTGNPEPLPGTTVMLAGTKLGVATDERGHYTLALPDTLNREKAKLSFYMIGFVSQQLDLPPVGAGVVVQDIQLAVDTTVITYAIQRPSLIARIRWQIKRWFGLTR